MTRFARKLSITYSTELIPSPKILSTLAVFYDEIWLPHLREDWSATEEELIIGRSKFMKWMPLYDENLLRMLPNQSLGDHGTLAKRLAEATLRVLGNEGELLDSNKDPWFHYSINSLIAHATIASKPSPELFVSDPTDKSTSRLAGFLVQSLFQYYVPQLQLLNAEQILEVRDYLQDTKEGFNYYVFEMIDDVERRIQERNFSEIEAAQTTFERKILPQYEEFRRQLLARNTGFWLKVLATGGKFFQINAAPWTPAFWGAVLEMFGVSLNEAAKADESELTNKSQAFHYLAKLERSVPE